MTVSGEIAHIRAGSEFHTCPSCGYDRGFHSSFLGANADKDNPIKSTREVYRVILICPECGARFDVGWRVSFAEFESRFVNVAPTAPPDSPHVTTVTTLPSLYHDRHLPE
jgi:hypothetical protein